MRIIYIIAKAACCVVAPVSVVFYIAGHVSALGLTEVVTPMNFALAILDGIFIVFVSGEEV